MVGTPLMPPQTGYMYYEYSNTSNRHSSGAGSGINLCFAVKLLEKGCNVVFADLALRPEPEAIVTQNPLTSANAKAVFQKTDMTDRAQLDAMFAVAIEHFRGADIVCPGAGVYEPASSNFWHPPGTFLSKDDLSSSRYALLDINLTHPIRVTQLAISHFLSQRRPGSIPHISSVVGQCPFFPTPIYGSAKHALSGFARSLAPLECPPAASGIPKIRVNSVAPALIRTPLWTENPDKMLFIKGDTGWTTAEAVADVTMALVEGEDNVGGTILEGGKTVRRVETFDDLGPSEGGNGAVNAEGFADPAWEGLTRMMPVEGGK